MINRILLVIIVITLGGCAAPRLAPIEYSGSVIHKSTLPAYVQVNTGKVTGYSTSTMIYAGGIFVPVTSGPVPELQFGDEDQKVFLESLKSQLLKHGIISALRESGAEDTLEVMVNFVQTEHFPNFQEYKITAVMLMKYGESTDHKKYSILSSEGDTTWTKWNTNALQGKTKAAEKLLAAVIPDIEKFVSTVSR